MQINAGTVMTRAYAYDTRDLITSNGVRTFGYDAVGRVTHAQPSSGPAIEETDFYGLSELIFNPAGRTISLFDRNQQIVAQTVAGNNAQKSSRGPWNPGTYAYSYHKDHGGGANGPYGSNGNYVFDVPGCVGCGVHSGRAEQCDKAGRCGTEHATNGCIRTTDEMTRYIHDLEQSGDPLTRIIVTQPGTQVLGPGNARD